MPKFYMVMSALLLVGYLFVEGRGMIFAGTDGPSGGYTVAADGRRTPRGLGFVIFGTGYRGGK